MGNRHPWVIGHRGASGYRPEHTAAAYETALRLGADAVEPDLVPTRDGVLVVRHENEISSTTDVADRAEFADRRITKVVDGDELTGWFTEDFTWAELATLRARERIPELRPHSAAYDGRWPILRFTDLLGLLDEARERDGRDAALVVELKHPTHFERLGLPLVELCERDLRTSGWSDHPERLIIESFDRAGLLAADQLGVPGSKVFLLDAAGLAAHAATDPASPVEAVDAWYANDPDPAALDGVSLDARILLGRDGLAGDAASTVQRLHGLGLSVWCWTLRAENAFLATPFRNGSDPAAYGQWRGQFAALIDSGLDGVFADQPDLALAVREGS